MIVIFGFGFSCLSTFKQVTNIIRKHFIKLDARKSTTALFDIVIIIANFIHKKLLFVDDEAKEAKPAVDAPKDFTAEAV